MLEHKLVSERARATKEIANWSEIIEQREKEIAELKSRLAQNEAVNSSANENPDIHDAELNENEICTLELKFAVEGRNVLYVGGLSKLTPHLRALVENNGGNFLHHDGGINDGAVRLTGLLEQADTVLCPLDFISHNACHKVKRFCKQYAKPVIMLRKPSLSSFVKGLQESVSLY